MKKIYCILLLSIVSLTAFSQNWNEIKNNDAYLYGEGFGATLKDADDHALSDLISKISITVSSKSTITDKNITKDSNNTSYSNFQNKIKTYTQATLTNTERVILKNEPDAHIGRWIKRSEINKIFEARKAKANDLIENALQAEEQGKADNALRCYYWAYALVQSLQHPDEAKYTDNTGKEHILTVWLPEQIKAVFADLKAVVEKKNENDVDLLITYKGKPVSSIDYTYFDGQDWSNIYSAKDGHGVLELASGNTADHYQLKYEYVYQGEAHIDKEMASVLEAIPSTPIRDAYIDIKSNDASSLKTIQPAFMSKKETNSTAKLTKPAEGSNQYAKVMAKVTKAITTKAYDTVSDLFTENGKDVYQKLIHYGNARIIGTPEYTFYQDGNTVIGRGVRMSFSFKTGMRKAFVEDVVFTFTNDGKIDNIAFGMGKTAENDILKKGIWAETARKAIMNFMENYKTAYALKRMDYITSIFDDDAVIITGNVTRKLTLNMNSEGNKGTVKGKDIITYNRQTKDEYLRNLAKCFKSNEFINIRFANNDVIKAAKGGELYGIQISQDYYSSNYGDKGYLFLLVDINNPKQPIIKVRTWQPEKDPNFGIYGLGDF